MKAGEALIKMNGTRKREKVDGEKSAEKEEAEDDLKNEEAGQFNLGEFISTGGQPSRGLLRRMPICKMEMV